MSRERKRPQINVACTFVSLIILCKLTCAQFLSTTHKGNNVPHSIATGLLNISASDMLHKLNLKHYFEQFNEFLISFILCMYIQAIFPCQCFCAVMSKCSKCMVAWSII